MGLVHRFPLRDEKFVLLLTQDWNGSPPSPPPEDFVGNPNQFALPAFRSPNRASRLGPELPPIPPPLTPIRVRPFEV